MAENQIIKVISGERFTPLGLAKKLEAPVILESSSFKRGRERYSLLMVRPAFSITESGGTISLFSDGKRRTVKGNYRDILDLLKYFADQHSGLAQDFPLPAGGMGFLSYEYARYCDTIRFRHKRDPFGLPEAAFLIGHIFIIFDHYTDVLYLIGLNYKEHSIDLSAALAETEAKINDLDFNYLKSEEMRPDELRGKAVPESGANGSDRESFMRGVETVRKEIIKGNLLQGVLSRKLVLDSEIDPLSAYRILRSKNPSPYLFYIDFGNFKLFGSSPEMHVKVKEGKITLRPIAGTRRRGGSPEEDRALEEELRNDEKERAEHLMLVDLARNDVGRISCPGTVELSSFMEVERYSHLMHLVSNVEGVLEEGMSGIDAVRSTFPAGTVSGAPKIRAIETIDAIEPEPRSFYAGLVGYIEPGGDLDSCITIRSGMKTGNKLVLQAGAGIVYDSEPEREYEETREKLAALAESAGVKI